MLRIGRKIYYEKTTGNVLVDTGERQGCVVATTFEQDIVSYKELSERNTDTFDFLEFEYGQYSQDFLECNGYKINTETLQLEFSYPTPIEEVSQEPIYQKSLSEEIKETKQAVAETNAMVLEFMETILMGGM